MVKKIAFALLMIPSLIAAQAEPEKSFSPIAEQPHKTSLSEKKCILAAQQLIAFINSKAFLNFSTNSPQFNDIINTYVRVLNEMELLYLILWYSMTLEVTSTDCSDIDFKRLAEIHTSLVQELDKVVERNYGGNKRLSEALYRIREYVINSQETSLDQMLQKYVNILTLVELSALWLTLTRIDNALLPAFDGTYGVKLLKVIQHLEKLMRPKANVIIR